jgi:integrase
MVFSILGIVERISNPQKLTDLTASRISAFQARLREEGKAEATIGAYSRHLKAALRWGVEVGMIQKAPKIRMPKRAKGAKAMKGRPVTTEEYERMLMVTHKVVGKEAAPSWKYYLEGLWWSGLRLAESLDLYWDRQDKLSVDFSGRRPMLRIPAELEKGNQNRQLAMAPEFCKFLERTPPENRKGRVFKLRGCKGSLLEAGTVSKRVCEIGHKAGVKVEETTRMGKPHIMYASAHDLRRSFGERWSTRVMPQVLMELMRHESIETTMKYYVGRNAERTADALWAAVEEKPLRAVLRASDDLEQIEDDCKSKKTSCFQASN